MPVVTAAALRKDIASGETAPLYVLVGADEVEKADIAAQFLELVDEGLRAFNVDRFYGADVSAAQVIDAANTHPMMVPRRVVVVLEAEKLLIPKRESKAAEEDQERLAAFVKSPAPHSTVVLVCGALDRRRNIVKLLLKEAHVVDCGTIEDGADAERWVKARAARERVSFEPAAVRALIERAGLDIVRLRAAFDRVVLYALGQATITMADVRESVPAGPETPADFGIANAIRDNDAAEALTQLAAALDSGAVPVMVLGQLRVAAERLPKPRVRAAVDALFRTDLALKSSGGDPRILLERLVVELCGEAPRRSFSGGGRPSLR
ncbi:MAG TPA: DNA polymerase III subunit delta [Vicinamibacterales bacterium]|nr:DNA polymerase III subunit delta [Vicinamibacterales bacterium]